MSVRPERLLSHLRQVVPPPAPDAESDRGLLRRFARDGDGAAFAALVGRYGNLVLAACRRVLRDPQQAQDAAQATWLLLARKAGAVRRPEGLSAWLYGAARRLALRCRRAEERCRRREARAAQQQADRPPSDPLDELTARELLQALEEEIERLPEVYRLAVVLVCLEGLSQEETARRLGWTAGSVKGRLERGRKRLHARLLRRGLSLPAALGAAEVTRGTGGAALAASWSGPTVKAATLLAAGQAVPAGLVPANVIALMKGALRTMFLKKLGRATGLLLAVAVAAAMGPLAYLCFGGQPAPRRQTPPTPAARATAGKPAGAVGFAWGQPHDGLRLGIAHEGAGRPAGGGARLALALENVGAKDLVLNLGMMLANGRKQYADALLVTLTGANRAVYKLRPAYGGAGVAGRLDPFVVPLPSGGRYTLRYDLANLVDEDPERSFLPPAPGRYRAAVAFVGKAVRQTNGDMTALALMPYWTGTIQSGEVSMDLRGPPGAKAPAKGLPLRAETAINELAWLAGDTDRLSLTFTLTNEGKEGIPLETINRAIAASKLVVNGTALEDSGLIFGNGPRPANVGALSPGKRVVFSYALGRYFATAGFYRLVWEGADFRSPEVIFRVRP